jgi:hypothetical protein
MSVDKAGGNKTPLQINDLDGVVIAEPGYTALVNRHRSGMYTTGKYVDELTVLEQEINRLPPHRYIDSFR